jgi:hypothetical protein
MPETTYSCKNEVIDVLTLVARAPFPRGKVRWNLKALQSGVRCKRMPSRTLSIASAVDVILRAICSGTLSQYI